jgi:hypothetical protein
LRCQFWLNKKYFSGEIMKKLMLIIAFCSIAYATPGYISRSCGPDSGFIKESITVNYTGYEYLYTRSYQAKRTSYSPYYRWERHDSNAGNRLLNGWRSYAGQVLSWSQWYNNDYYLNVYGFHWWYNKETRRIERRQEGVTNCNLGTWGINNW